MALMRTYSIREYQLNRGKGTGIDIDGASLRSERQGERVIYLPALDGAEYGIKWGRFHYECEMEEDAVVLIRTLAFENKKSEAEIKEAFRTVEPSVNHKDILLFDRIGRYLYIMIEVVGNGAARISGMKVLNPGDNFMNTFPEIYRVNNSVFHRFMAIFSTIYNDFDEEIENVDRLLDIDNISKELLGRYASWIGISLDKSIPIEAYRKLLKEAYYLNSIKGTEEVIRRIVKIMTGCECRIVERVFWNGEYLETNREMVDKLYGSEDNCVTVLINGQEDVDKTKALLALLNQFKSARVKLSVVYTADSNILDSYSFISENTRIGSENEGVIGSMVSMGEGFVLK